MLQDHGTPSTGDLDHGVFLLSRVEGMEFFVDICRSN